MLNLENLILSQGVAQSGRVPGLEPGCRRFKSYRPDQVLRGYKYART